MQLPGRPRPVGSVTEKSLKKTLYLKVPAVNSRTQDMASTPGMSRKRNKKRTFKAVKAEERDLVSLEVAFAYRAKSAARNLGAKAKNAHLFLSIYLPAGLRLRKYLVFLSTFECCVIYLVPGEVQADDLFI